VARVHPKYSKPIRGYSISPSTMFSIMNSRFNLGVGADLAVRRLIVYRLTGLPNKDIAKLSAKVNSPQPDIDAINGILGRVKLNLVIAGNTYRIVDITAKYVPEETTGAAPTVAVTAEQRFEEFCKAAKKADNPFIEGFASLGETQKTELATMFSKREPKLIVRSIKRFGIPEECVWAAVIEKCCESKEGALETLRLWDELNMKEPDSIINALTACALHGAATETAKILNSEILDDDSVRSIARLCMDYGGAREIAFCRNVVRKLFDADKLALALINVREQDNNFAADHFLMFRIRDDGDKAKVAAEHFTKFGWGRFSLDIGKFGITSAKELNRLAALWMVAHFEERLGTKVHDYKKQFSDEDLATLENVAVVLCTRLRGDDEDDLGHALNDFMMDRYTEGVPMLCQLVELMRKKRRDEYWGVGFRF